MTEGRLGLEDATLTAEARLYLKKVQDQTASRVYRNQDVATGAWYLEAQCSVPHQDAVHSRPSQELAAVCVQ